MFLKIVFHFFMKTLLLHKTLQYCFLVWCTLWNRCK